MNIETPNDTSNELPGESGHSGRKRLRTVLLAGAVLSCTFGAFLICRFAREILKVWSQFPDEPGKVVLALCFYWGYFVYIFLAFAPMVILRRSHSAKSSVRSLIVAGIAELIVIAMFFAMLITLYGQGAD